MLGCDIIEISRISASLDKFGESFIQRILGVNEIELLDKRSNKAEFLAGRFAAKESVAKSLKTGIGHVRFSDIEILPDLNGAPEVYIKGVKKENIQVSISHSKLNAIAVSTILCKENK